MNDRFKFRFYDKQCKMYLSDGYYINGDKWMDDYYEDVSDLPEYIIPEQCTGLKDKNGNLIYEGDIVRCSDGNIYNIRWSDAAMIMIAVNTATKIGDAIYKLKCYDEFEIIGNIHEQKEQQ